MFSIPNISSNFSSKEMIVLVALALLSGLFSLLLSIFTMLAINEDANAIGVKNKTVYIVLAFFIPVLMAIIYVCKRKKAEKIQPKICTACGASVNSSTAICPRCANSNFVDYLITGNEAHHKKAKIFAIIAVIAFVLNMGVSLVSDIYEKNNSIFDIKSYNYETENNDINDFFNQFEE